MRNNKNRIFILICAFGLILSGCKGAGSDNNAEVTVTNQSNDGNIVSGNGNNQNQISGNDNTVQNGDGNNFDEKEQNVSGNNNTLIQADNITVYVDGAVTTLKNINGEEVSPIIYNHDVYFPITAVSEEIKTPVQYDSETGAVYVGKNPNGKTNMLDIIEAYDTCGFRQYSFLKSGGVERFEMAGKNYVDGAVLEIVQGGSACAHFGLDKQYKKFSFKINHINGAAMHDIVFRVYTDGIIKIEETIKSSDYLKAYEFSVENVLQLKIEAFVKGGGYYTNTSYGMIDMELEPV